MLVLIVLVGFFWFFGFCFFKAFRVDHLALREITEVEEKKLEARREL